MTFAERLLAWYDLHGRHDLPWQHPRSPYRVWIAEIMLQQTQVTTVIPYFERFMTRFPDLASLASTSLDEVLHLWSGLGYYARARNLHRTAGLLMSHRDGEFPLAIDDLAALPGIGRSTAGAILAQSRDQRHPILDGNVRRVLCRYRAIAGWPGTAAIQRRLWALSESLTPQERVCDYTQAIMDLGATVCTRRRPACSDCPLADDCSARLAGEVSAYPEARPKRKLPTRRTTMLLLRDPTGRTCLVRRPPSGIWGGLWSLPECTDGDPRDWARERLGLDVRVEPAVPALRHTFSHFHLDIDVIPATLERPSMDRCMESSELVWYKDGESPAVGIAAPIRRIIENHGDLT